jgi:hypothetical protein
MLEEIKQKRKQELAAIKQREGILNSYHKINISPIEIREDNY